MILRSLLPTFTLLAVFIVHDVHAQPSTEDAVQLLEDEWAEVFYKLPSNQQASRFKALLPRVQALQEQYPKRAEPLILEAIVLCTLASTEWGFSSLTRLSKARELLIRSIDFDPKAMGASAFITLGNLYFRLPGWPISYGDDELARQYLESAVKLFPDALDANYFLGDYWLHEEDHAKALQYLEKADQAPVRPNHLLSDTRIKEELQPALTAARKGEEPHTDFFSSLIPELGDETEKVH